MKVDQSIEGFIKQLSKPEGTITDAGEVDNKTRQGRYLKIKRGLSWAVYFVGLDKVNCVYIAEVVQ